MKEPIHVFLFYLSLGFFLLCIGQASAMADFVTYDNVYLGQVVAFHPQKAGAARTGAFEVGMIGPDSMPILNDFALGPPTGTGSGTSGVVNDGLIVGINGSATFKFQEGYYIYNGPGDDFRTWGDRFCWGGMVDEHVSELAHIQVSADGENWYYNSAEAWDPDEYGYYTTRGLHGNTPNWANYTKDMQAQQDVDGRWTNIPGVVVPKDFNAFTPYLGGDTFDLSDYRSLSDESPWQDEMQMVYIRMVDDNDIPDGQGYSPWQTGAIMQAAMGINVMKVSAVPVPGSGLILGFGIIALIGIRRKTTND